MGEKEVIDISNCRADYVIVGRLHGFHRGIHYADIAGTDSVYTVSALLDIDAIVYDGKHGGLTVGQTVEIDYDWHNDEKTAEVIFGEQAIREIAEFHEKKKQAPVLLLRPQAPYFTFRLCRAAAFTFGASNVHKMALFAKHALAGTIWDIEKFYKWAFGDGAAPSENIDKESLLSQC
ncbi:MAG: hypothetical protein HY897_22250 [Deltaproteobacteria bacterium]|nr:hypothetical protein [Deltaproteobacteria bacterium]